jgi:inhibitor of KinA
MPVPGHRIVAAGDSALIVEFEERIDVAVNRRAVALADALRTAAVPGVRDIVPTFRSVAIYFDPLKTDVDLLSRQVQASAGADGERGPDRVPIRIPVCYGGLYGPDLRDVAAFSGLTESAVVDLHTAATYRVFMLGFLPGFAYMGTVDERIAMPRRETPRVRVPAGSVGIAGRQTGIYPAESPGGWRLIGVTPLKAFDVDRADPFLFAPGDQVQFFAVDAGALEGTVMP